MGKKSVRGLSVLLIVLPVAIISLVLLCTGLLIGHYGKAYLLDELYGPHLNGLVAEKQQDIDAWCASLKKDVTALSAQPLLRDHVSRAALLDQGPKGGAPSPAAAVNSLLKERTSPEGHMVLALITPSGTVVAASHPEILKEDWSEGAVTKRMKQPPQNAVILGPVVLNRLNGIAVVAPVPDKGGKTTGLLISLASPQGFVERLRIERGLYRTEEIDLISRDGEALLTSKGVPKTKVKYTVPWAPSQGVREHGSVVYTLVELKEAPFGLIGSVVTEEFLAPLRMFLMVFAVCALLIAIAVAAYNFLIVPSLVTGPLKRLAGAVRAAADGTAFDPGAASGYRGEMRALFNAVSGLLSARGDAVAAGRDLASGSTGAESEARRKDSDLEPVVHNDIRTRIAVIHETSSSMHKAAARGADPRYGAGQIRDMSQHSLRLLDLASDLARIRQGSAPITPSAFSVKELMDQVMGEAREGLSHKEITLISDIDASVMNETVHNDRERVRGILVAMILLASAPFQVGAVTLFAARSNRKGRETLDIAVMPVSADPDACLSGVQAGTDEAVCLVAAEITRLMGGTLVYGSTETPPKSYTLSLPLSPK